MTRQPARRPLILRIDPAGFPFIGGALALAVLAGALGGWLFAVPVVLLALFFAFFFRDPERHVPAAASDNDVLSPADGGCSSPATAMADARRRHAVGILAAGQHLPVADGRARQPRAGVRARHARGADAGPVPAGVPPRSRRRSTSAARSGSITHGQPIVARQIVGILARRVVCRLEEGASVRAGDRLGVMKFGSRMDVFLPANAAIAVKVGDKVRGGETVIAVLHSR